MGSDDEFAGGPAWPSASASLERGGGGDAGVGVEVGGREDEEGEETRGGDGGWGGGGDPGVGVEVGGREDGEGKRGKGDGSGGVGGGCGAGGAVGGSCGSGVGVGGGGGGACNCVGCGEGATAAVYRDPNGSLLAGINSTIVTTSPLAAEVLAVKETLIMSRNFQMEKVIIESDNHILVQALKSHASIAVIQVILDDILYSVKGMSNCGFTWAPRETNLLAHEVAKLTVVSVTFGSDLKEKGRIRTSVVKESRGTTGGKEDSIRSGR
ncbi:uncharacterized protein LOC130983200 [Arachis stenosperma]|uniref:uncharacterized protein LOC130983200 n=1 Tax=Arachis stenosperma TaxID=217475 RepID=UPI0025AC422E|nr:uncharacterized protein LOC130983200 [Arachis stenosperma]